MRAIKYIFVVLTLCLSARGKAQLYDSLAKGLPETVHMAYYDTVFNKLYVSGWFGQTNDGLTINCIGSWDGAKWDSLKAGFTGGNWARAGSNYQGQLYVVGGFSFVDWMNIKYVARWNGTQWDSLPNSQGAGGIDMLVYNDTLYLCGGFYNINSDTSIRMVAKWDGTTWSNVGNPLTIIKPGYIPACIEFMNGDLYVAGQFERITGELIHLIKWDGTNWSVPGNGMEEGGISNIWDMAVYKSELYITGLFSKYATGGAGTSQHLTKWDGTQFKNVGGDGPDQWCKTLCVHNDKLYLGGNFSYINGMPARCFASFDGTNWCGYNTNTLLSISKIAKYRGDTLVLSGGWFIEGGDTIPSIALWTGESYVDTCKIANGIEENTVTEHNFTVYPNPNSGSFTIQFTQPLNNGYFSVINAVGQIVYQKQCSVEHEEKINIPDLSRGVYFLVVQAEGSRSMSIMVVE